MTVSQMAAVIINKYGTTIRGREVYKMSDHQIYAIYESIRKREEKESRVATQEARCATCEHLQEGVCGKFGFRVNPTTLACAEGYSGIDKM